MIQTIGTTENVMTRRALSCLLALSAMAVPVLGAPQQAQQDKAPERFSAVFLSMASPEDPAKLAVQSTGDPSARLELWVDFDRDGIWSESERVLEGAALAEQIAVFDITSPPGLGLLPELNARFRVSGDMPLEWVQRIGDSEPAAPSALPETSVPVKGTERCEWASGFHIQGLNFHVNALVVFDDGSGPALYVGGVFVGADDVVVNRIAKWDGNAWTALGSGMNDEVEVLTVHDDGSGMALYAGGWFTSAGGVNANRIAKWDGTAWTALGSGMNHGVYGLAVYDDGSGVALYAGGWFHTAGGVSARSIAKWDGTAWTALGSGMNGGVNVLTVHDDGSGTALYAGGSFTNAGGVSAERIAKWDGAAWMSVGSGMNNSVWALTAHDDGNGAALYAGGYFTTAGGVNASRIAKWDGTTWAAVGSGMNSGVNALTVHDDGNGAALYAGGHFTTAGGANASKIAKWNGTSWSFVGTRIRGAVNALAVYDEGSGAALFAGGSFTNAENANYITKKGFSRWQAVSGIGQSGNGTAGWIHALTVYDDGNGEALYAGGDFTSAGGGRAGHIAKRNGTRWETALGSGVNNSVYALAVYDDGSGSALYVGGHFTIAGGEYANRIAKWDGTAWTAVGSGMNGGVNALRVHDDGSGAALYAGGGFTSAGGVSANRIAKWDGTAWAAVGSGVNSSITALAAYDDGNGEALYAAGYFTSAGGVDASRIAKWDGTAWTAVGAGITGMNDTVFALTVYDDGSGEALYAGGNITSVGGVDPGGIAKWDGTAWTAVGSGLNDRVDTLAVHDDGGGATLYVGGWFTSAGVVNANRVAKWDGTAWAALGSGLDQPVYAMTAFDAGAGRTLYVGGTLGTAGGLVSAHFAEYSCGPNLSLPTLTEVATGTTTTLPIHLTLHGTPVASASFSVDYDSSCLNPDVDGDGNLDNLSPNVSPGFTVTPLFDPADTDGEIDISIADLNPPTAMLKAGDLLSIGFQATCTGSPTTPIDAAVRFSLDPSPAFGGADHGAVPSTWSDGIVRIWPGQRGDCDASGVLDAQDLTSIGLEIFDSDGEYWSDAPASDFVGSPVGCDANAGTRIRAADVVCANLLALAGTCTNSKNRLGLTPELAITITQVEQAPSGELVWIRAEARQMQGVASLAFSLDLDPSYFDFASVDINSDGVPDHLRYPQGAPDFSVVLWSSADGDGELDVLLAGLSGQALAEGGLIEIGIPVADEWLERGIALSQAPTPSFGSTTGSDLGGVASVHLSLFSDGFESGNTSAWSSTQPLQEHEKAGRILRSARLSQPRF